MKEVRLSPPVLGQYWRYLARTIEIPEREIRHIRDPVEIPIAQFDSVSPLLPIGVIWSEFRRAKIGEAAQVAHDDFRDVDAGSNAAATSVPSPRLRDLCVRND